MKEYVRERRCLDKLMAIRRLIKGYSGPLDPTEEKYLVKYGELLKYMDGQNIESMIRKQCYEV